MVMAQAKIIVAMKPTPERSMKGMIRNIGMDGRKNQKAPSDNRATFSGSRVSANSQIIDSSDTRGSEARSPPQPGSRSDMVATSATMSPENAALKRKLSM